MLEELMIVPLVANDFNLWELHHVRLATLHAPAKLGCRVRVLWLITEYVWLTTFAAHGTRHLFSPSACPMTHLKPYLYKQPHVLLNIVINDSMIYSVESMVFISNSSKYIQHDIIISLVALKRFSSRFVNSFYILILIFKQIIFHRTSFYLTRIHTRCYL